MSYVDTGAWSCPSCPTTVRGNARTRRHAQRSHGRYHANHPETVVEQPDRSMSPEPAPPVHLVIPRAPKGQRRGPRPRR